MDSEAAAEQLARSAVTGQLAACAQVAGPVRSIYRWRGEIEDAAEWLVVFKTTTDRYPDLERHIRDTHTYEVPEILCTPVIAGNGAYLDWIVDEVRGRAGGLPGTT